MRTISVLIALLLLAQPASAKLADIPKQLKDLNESIQELTDSMNQIDQNFSQLEEELEYTNLYLSLLYKKIGLLSTLVLNLNRTIDKKTNITIPKEINLMMTTLIALLIAQIALNCILIIFVVWWWYGRKNKEIDRNFERNLSRRSGPQ
ncbi:MAG: hypothetical protein DRG33_03670 [Deltaproteobacteria bacterium]|nr:MAG: hypothetical protein DRG33_03670 [Deltaproteobacteria bacterium]